MASGSYEGLKLVALERGPAMVDQGTRASHPLVMPAGRKKMMMWVKVLVAQRKKLGADTESEVADRTVRDGPPEESG